MEKGGQGTSYDLSALIHSNYSEGLTAPLLMHHNRTLTRLIQSPRFDTIVLNSYQVDQIKLKHLDVIDKLYSYYKLFKTELFFFITKQKLTWPIVAECHLMKRLSTKDMSLALCSLPTFITCLWIETSRGCWPPLLFCCLFVLPQLNPKNLKNPLVMAKIDQLLFNGCSFFFFSVLTSIVSLCLRTQTSTLCLC